MKLKTPLISLALSIVILSSQSLAFLDVPETAWYKSSVESLKEKGIIDDSEFFRPADTLNRAELVKMVIEATGGLGNHTAPENSTFSDVPTDSWFRPYIEIAATKEIVLGYKANDGSLLGLFGPADTVTRAAAVKIIALAFDLDEKEVMGSKSFTDVKSSDWHYEYVNIAAEKELVAGYDDGSFKPNNPVTRAEMAKILSLAIESSKEEMEMEEEEEDTQEEEVGETGEEVEEGVMEEEIEVNEIIFEENEDLIEASPISNMDEFKLVARYQFEGQKEGFLVQTLTVSNDITGDLFGDQSQPSIGIKEVQIKYPNEDGLEEVRTNSLNGDGEARFSNLNFFATEDKKSTLEIYASLNDIAEIGPLLSGEVFRLGLKDNANTIDSFKAVGEFSGNVVNSGNGFLQSTATDVEPFIIRKGFPYFTTKNTDKNLFSGSHELIELDVTAIGNSIALGRLVFDLSINESQGANLSVDDFELHRNGKLVESVYIYEPTTFQELSTGSLTNGQYQIIVSFEEAEVISKNQTNSYTLEAVVVNASNNDVIVTSLNEDDRNMEPTGLSDVFQENTGKVYAALDASKGLFTGGTQFSQSIMNGRNIIWSDLSGSPHNHPSVSAGNTTNETGSSDWTNGYLLDMKQLESSFLSN